MLKINKEVVDLYRMIKVVGIDEFTEPCGSQYALNYATENNMDLVLVNSDVNIPICKIYDVKKKHYESKKRQKENKSTKTKLKTIQLGLDMTDNDKSYRIKNTIKFIEKKNQVKITLLIKGGRNMARGTKVGGHIIQDFIDKINKNDLTWNTELISQPKLDGNRWTAIITGKKK